jgi:protein-S-isoprenylcysteine O-methyltransferase Ste14
MIAIYIIAGIIFLCITIYGIWRFYLYVREVYDYNVFNGWIIAILTISFLFFLVLLFLYNPHGGKITELDLFVSGGVACVAILGAFFWNWKNTTFLVALVATVLQTFCALMIAIIVIIVIMSTLGRSKKEERIQRRRW